MIISTILGAILILAIGGLILTTLGMLVLDMKQDFEYGNWSGFFTNLALLLAILSIVSLCAIPVVPV
jgi:hypothetical protein